MGAGRGSALSSGSGLTAGSTCSPGRVRRSPDNIAVEVEDDGCGFEMGRPAADGFGLIGMQERATMAGGTLRVVSSPGEGTTVRATVPICQP